MNYFTDCKTIEEAKKVYRKYALELHPDQGGNKEEFKTFQNQFEDFLKNFIQGRVNIWKKENSEKADVDINTAIFADILQKIMHLNIRIEIIGFWIYAFESFTSKEYLSSLGFWFSKSKRAWIYSGTKKINMRGRFSVKELRNRHGYAILKEKEKDKEEQILVQEKTA